MRLWLMISFRHSGEVRRCRSTFNRFSALNPSRSEASPYRFAFLITSEFGHGFTFCGKLKDLL